MSEGESVDYAEKLEGLTEQLRATTEERQNLELEVKDIERVLSEIESLPDGEAVYHMVGNILIKRDRESVKKELEEKKENDNLMIQTLKQREDALAGEITKLRREMVLKSQAFRVTGSS
ncbi:MAG: prefoldin subunit [Candidatus Marsarchaeota archaeon]|jgi:prefoldin beta subunit